MARNGLTRRGILKTAGSLVVAAGLPAPAAARAQGTSPAGADITGRLARYMVTARDAELPAEVVREAKHRILDTIGAIVSGAAMKPGEAAITFVRQQGGTPEATVISTDIRTSAINAALANGMFGHADETDDFEPITKAHPGCAVVPAAFAVAERERRSGTEFLRAVTLGYDLCCRFLMALGPDHVRATHRSAEGTSSTFGAVGAAASLARLNEEQMRYAISYAAQQVSGLWSWVRDNEHIEKAFDFGGMGARNGVSAALMVQSGFTGVREVLDGEHNMIDAMSREPRPAEMVADLGRRFWVTETAIKTFSVGYPIQAPLDALLQLRHQHNLTADNVDRIVARLPKDGADIVNGRTMPDVNIQYVLAVGLLDGTVSFADSHSFEKMKDPRVMAVMKRVQLVGDPALVVPDAPRSGAVEVTLRDGRTVSHFTRHAPGTKENPVNADAINAKVRDLMVPVIGVRRTDEVFKTVHAVEQVKDMREFVRSLLGA